jgi:hypothetical protein
MRCIIRYRAPKGPYWRTLLGGLRERLAGRVWVAAARDGRCAGYGVRRPGACGRRDASGSLCAAGARGPGLTNSATEPALTLLAARLLPKSRTLAALTSREPNWMARFTRPAACAGGGARTATCWLLRGGDSGGGKARACVRACAACRTHAPAAGPAAAARAAGCVCRLARAAARGLRGEQGRPDKPLDTASTPAALAHVAFSATSALCPN